MSVDVACGELGFLDLTFVGLDALPGPGEERHARALERSPGGGATIAIACARLGLRSALASPIGADDEGLLLRAALAAEDVEVTGRTIERTAVTVVMPVDGERAMATVEPGEWVRPEDLAAGDPRAVVVSLPRVDRAPADTRLYVTAGDADARAFAAARTAATPAAAAAPTAAADPATSAAAADPARSAAATPAAAAAPSATAVAPARGPVAASPHAVRGALARAAGLIVNAREAALMTGEADPRAAARALAALTPCAVVTLGADGAVACDADGNASAPGVPADVVDTTGAGDLFTAAYVWADLAGASLKERLRWATLYAARGVETATAVAGAMRLGQFEDEITVLRGDTT